LSELLQPLGPLQPHNVELEMVSVPSTMLPLGTAVPDFVLINTVDDHPVSPRDFAGRNALLVMFICNHCPFVKHVKDELGRLAAEYEPRGLAVIAINSNDLEAYPQDGPDRMRELALEEGWRFPFLFDETQDVAKAFRAACTPDFFLFDHRQRLAYRGQLDDSRPSNGIPVTGRDLRAAIEAVLAGKPVSGEQRPSIGCNIKWRAGAPPEYFAPAARK
jgi:thiol-disulfide isomerase/thioredoxin